MVWPFRKKDRFDEAGEWDAKMRGPHAERYRAAFEKWLAADPAHPRTYEQVKVGYRRSGELDGIEMGRTRNLPRRTQKVPLRYAFAAALLLMAVISAVLLSGSSGPPNRRGEASAIYATKVGETRRITLPDGSQMTLWSDSGASIGFTNAERRITLTRGRGRFSVAHEARSFRVAAGDAEVVAHGTLFDVALLSGRTRVSLLQGSVEVSYPEAPSKIARRVTRMTPGQSLVVGGPRVRAVPKGRAGEARSTSTMLEFEGTPLGQAVAEINSRGSTKIRLADPAIGRLRVTGAFRAGDTASFAQSLEAAFGLRLERRVDGTLILHPKGPMSNR